MKKNGFTLLEILLYIGISAIMAMVCFSFFFRIIGNKTKQERIAEVEETGQFVLKKMTYYLRRANTVGAATVYNVSPGTLVLNYSVNPQVIFDTYQKQIVLAGSPIMITKMRMQVGAGPAVDITGDKLQVTNFLLKDFSNAEATTVEINLSLASVNPTGISTYAAQNSWTTSVTLRKR